MGRHDADRRRVEQYALEWYETTPAEFEIDWSIVEFRVSGRMTKAFGNARNKGGDMRITISAHAIANEPWSRVQETIRHEAIHIWQYQTDGVSGGHNRSFDRWAAEFGCKRNAEKPSAPPKFIITCEGCGKSDGRTRRSKVVEQAHRYSCRCGGDLRVEKGPGHPDHGGAA